MKKLDLSSRAWVAIALAALLLMFGAVQVVRKGRTGDIPISTETEVPLNTLTDDTQPPMPGDETPLVGETSPPPLDLPLSTPVVSDAPDAPASPTAINPVVWVSEEGAFAYEQPGFNMPKVRPLQKWEELQIVEATSEAWDRVRDLQGKEFWVQKKLVTIIRPQNLTQPSVAEERVMQFYTEVADGKHSDAYSLLSPEWKRELSFDDFVTGYAKTDSLRTEIVQVFELAEDRYQVNVSQEAVEQGEPINYLGIYTVEKVDGKWFLTTGSLKKQQGVGPF